MSVQLINPPGLVEPQGYTHVGVATGSRMVFLSGQVAQDAEGNVVGKGDLAAQTEQALRNVGLALAGAGATFLDVSKTGCSGPGPARPGRPPGSAWRRCAIRTCWWSSTSSP